MKGILSGSVAALVAALVALAAAPARADVDVEVPLALKAKGTMAGETEIYRFWAAEGTVVAMKFATAKKSLLTELDIDIFGPGNEPIGLPVTTVSDGKKEQFKGLELPFTGMYRVDLAASGTGDYTFDLKGKVRTLWKGETNLSGGTTELPFAAPPGAFATLKAVRKTGSTTTPRWANLVGESETGPDLEVDLSALGKLTDSSHIAAAGPFPGGPSYAFLGHTGDDGPALWQVKLKIPKVKTKKLDTRAKTLGRDAGGETMFVRVVDGAGGTVQVHEDGGSDLYGASVTFPPGALAGPTSISIASTEAPTPPSGDDQAAGPAVDLGPGGLVFDGDVTVTLPFDESLLPVGYDAGDLRVLIVEDDGSTRIVVPDSTDSEADTVTLTTDTFSTCIPIVRSGLPRLGLAPGGDEYWFLQVGGEMFPGAGNDSRGRSLTVGFGEASFFGDNSLQFNLELRGVEWQNQGGSAPLTADAQGVVDFVNDGGTATWEYGGDGQSITLPGLEPVLFPSRDGSVMAGRAEAPAGEFGESLLFVRKHAAELTTASVQGTWHVGTLDYSEEVFGNGSAGPAAERGFGTVTFSGTGTAGISVVQRVLVFNESNGTYSQVKQTLSVPNGTYAIDGDEIPGTILLTLPPLPGDDTGTTLRIFPGTGLDVMVGTQAGSSDAPLALVLTRQGAGMNPSVLDGTYRGAEQGIDASPYVLFGSVHVSDFTINTQRSLLEFNGGSSALAEFYNHHVQRDEGEGDGISVSDSGLVVPSDEFPLSVSVTSVGKMTLSAAGGGVVGAVAPGGQFAFYVSNPANTDADFALGFLVKVPPPPPE